MAYNPGLTTKRAGTNRPFFIGRSILEHSISQAWAAYGSSGNPKGARHEPRNAYDQQQAGPKGYGRKNADKAALLPKMKANAEKAQKADK